MNWKILLFCWTFFLQALNAQNLGAIQSEKYFPNSKDPTRFPIGCSPQVLKTQPGLAVKLYSYGHPVPGCSYITYQYPDFPRSGYKKERKLADITGVNGKIDIDLKPNDPCRVLTGHLPSNYNYPDTLTYTNFTMILYGYFQPKVTGYHTFNLEADDLLFMNLGAGNAFDCCKAESTLDNFGNYQSYSLWGSDYAKANITVFLVSGVYYPIRLFYVNRDNNAVIDFSFTTEFDKEKVHDFTSYFFSASDGEQCPGSVNYNYNCADVKSSTILTSSTTVDKQEGNIVPITKTIYEIGVPCDPEQPTQKCPGEFYNPIRDACEPLPTPSQDINSSGSSSSDSFSLPPPYTTTVSKSTTTETDIVSFFPSTDSKGHTRTGTITITLTKPSGEADYTTTITSDGHTITEVVSHITTTDSDGNTVTYTTTMASFDQVGDGVYTSAPPYSQPPVVTTTVTEDDGSSKTVVISYSPSEGEDGVTRTGTTTISTITPSGEADYTTTITSDGHTITEVVSHITTTDSDGNTVTYTTTMASFDQVGDGVYTSAPPYSQPPVVTTTVTEDDGSSKTVVISYSPSEGEDGVTRTGTTTISTITPSGEADYTTTIDKGNGDFETDLVSHITTKDSNGNPTTIVTTIPLKPSDAGEADYTTTITSDGHTITEVVSHITTTDSDGNTVTYTTTMASFDQVGDGVYTSAPPYSQPPVVTTTVTEDDGSSKTVVISYSPSEGEDGVTRTGTTTISTITPSGEADYTTTITSAGHTITEVVSHITTTDSDGNTVTYTTTMASFDQVGDGVYTSAPPYSQPPVVTTTVTEDDGSSKTVVISYSPSEGEDGVTRTGTTTISTITPSGEADYTTTIDKGNGDFETDLVSHITTKDSNGNPTTIVTTIPLKPSDAGEADYTTTITSDGHTITEVVSHITTTDSDGNTVTYTTTMASFDQVGDGVYTSAPPYSQPPVVTTTVTEDDGSSKTVVISYSPSEGEDGVTRTGTTTISTITPSGEADYTTTIDKGNGDFETDLVSHITTKDSNGNPTPSSPPSH
ncbi:hypothetical protein J6894_00003 [Nakaseomyces glabratus]|nr:hypothetical protein J6894_00003 [Nakaseomyces glabratus]